jgi:lysylphosphatidylglycerol synthetase-like protein (DUF2156 family)
MLLFPFMYSVADILYEVYTTPPEASQTAEAAVGAFILAVWFSVGWLLYEREGSNETK